MKQLHIVFAFLGACVIGQTNSASYFGAQLSPMLLGSDTQQGQISYAFEAPHNFKLDLDTMEIPLGVLPDLPQVAQAIAATQKPVQATIVAQVDEGFLKQKKAKLLQPCTTGGKKMAYALCVLCKKHRSKKELAAHLKMHHNPNHPYKCSIAECGRTYADQNKCERHQKLCHGGNQFTCGINGCTKSYSTKNSLLDHQRKQHFRLS